MRVQPAWAQFVNFDKASGAIEVSYFPARYVGNPDRAGKYSRKSLQAQEKLVNRINDALFRAENERSTVGDVRIQVVIIVLPSATVMHLILQRDFLVPSLDVPWFHFPRTKYSWVS
jgi:hypothetical protein